MKSDRESLGCRSQHFETIYSVTFRERAKFCGLYFESVAENAQFYSQPGPLYPRGRVFQISLAWNTKFKAQETISLQTFLHFVTIYYSSKQEELCNQMPKSCNAVQIGFPSTSWDSHSCLFAAAFLKCNFWKQFMFETLQCCQLSLSHFGQEIHL